MITALEHKILECMDRKSAMSPVVVYEDAVLRVTIDWLHDAYNKFETNGGRYYRVHVSELPGNDTDPFPNFTHRNVEVREENLIYAILGTLYRIRKAYRDLHQNIDTFLSQNRIELPSDL